MDGKEFATIENPRSEGEGVAFRITRGDGTSMDLWCDIEQLGHLMAAACQMGAFLRKVSGETDKDPEAQTAYSFPSPLKEASFEPPMADSSEVRLVLDIGLRVSVPVDREGLKELATEFSQVALALSADESSPQ